MEIMQKKSDFCTTQRIGNRNKIKSSSRDEFRLTHRQILGTILRTEPKT